MVERTGLTNRKGYFYDINKYDTSYNERVRRRKASKDLECEECDRGIKKGEEYVRDEFYFPGDEFEHSYKKVNFICLKCWTKELPPLTSTNMKRK